MDFLAAGEDGRHPLLRVHVVQPPGPRPRQLPRLAPATVGDLVPVPEADPDSQRPGRADVLDERVAGSGPQGVQGAVHEAGRRADLGAASLGVPGRFLQPALGLGIASKRCGRATVTRLTGTDSSSSGSTGRVRAGQPPGGFGAPKTCTMSTRSPRLIPRQVPPLGQADQTGELELHERDQRHRPDTLDE